MTINLPDTIGIYCPLEVDGTKFRLRQANKACSNCKYCRGVKELTVLDVPPENKYHVICQAPMTRSLRDTKLY